MKKLFLTLSITLITCCTTFSQYSRKDTTNRKFFVGSSMFILGNFASSNKPDFGQLNFGYRVNPKNTVSLELITWKYAWPLGIPYGDDFEAPEYEYPGYVREFGVAFAYQHFWWKGLYSSIHAMNALQIYVDDKGDKIQNGYQLFMTYRVLGYHLSLFKNRFFIEPSVGITHWPVNTNVPDGFKKMENQWSNYLLFEPGLHFGISF
ncbi:MAG: hypothetical protein MI922_06375 [Bacteroidales bacterium]|nr:hypothetical protein [Bacteroidales bacterium]